MKSNQSGNLLVINIDKLRDILGVSLVGSNIKLPEGIDITVLVNKLIQGVTDDFDSHAMSLEDLTNSYKSLASMIITTIRNNLLGRHDLANNRFLMNAVINGVSDTTEEFCYETLKKFVIQDEWADVVSRINENNKHLSNHPWSQVKGFNPNTGTFNRFGVPNVGMPPGGSPFGFPSEPPKEMQDNLRAEFLNNRVVDLEKNLNDLGVMVIRLAEKLDLVPNKSTSAEKSFEKMNLKHFMNRLDGFEMYLNDLGKAVYKLNKEFETLSDRLPKQESSDVVVTGFKEGGSPGLPEVNKEAKQPDVKRNVSIEQPASTTNEEERGADGNVDSLATIKSISPDAEAYYNK